MLLLRRRLTTGMSGSETRWNLQWSLALSSFLAASQPRHLQAFYLKTACPRIQAFALPSARFGLRAQSAKRPSAFQVCISKHLRAAWMQLSLRRIACFERWDLGESSGAVSLHRHFQGSAHFAMLDLITIISAAGLQQELLLGHRYMHTGAALCWVSV